MAKGISRSHGRAQLDPQRTNRQTALIVEAVVERLTSQLGSEVEISARQPEGFDEATIRTVSENSRTLKFEPSGFEEQIAPLTTVRDIGAQRWSSTVHPPVP